MENLPDMPTLDLSQYEAKDKQEADKTPLPDMPKLDLTQQDQEGPQLPEMPELDLAPDAGQKFAYGFKTMPSFTEGVADYLERRFPMGRINIYTPGRGWHMPEYVAPPKEVVAAARAKNYAKAKELLDQRNEYEVQSFAPWVSTDKSQQGGLSEFAGTAAAVLMDPTTLIPVAKTAKMAYVTAGAIGAADAAAYGLSLDDKADPLLMTLGAAGGVVGIGTMRYLGGKLSRLFQSSDKRQVEALSREFELKVAQYRKDKGMSTAKAWKAAADDMSLNEDALTGMQVALNRKFDFRMINATEDLAAKEARDSSSKLMDKLGLPNPFKGAAKTFDDILGSISTRLNDVSETLGGRLRRLDSMEHLATHKDFEELDPWFSMLKKIKRKNKPLYRELSRKLFNEDSDAEIVKLLEKNGVKDAMSHMNKLRKVLDRHFKELTAAGNKLEKVPYYYPRIVRDMPGLLKKMPEQMRTELEINARKAGINATDHEEYGAYINKWLRGRKGKQIDKILGNVKDREIKKLSDEMLDYYEDPIRSLHSMIRRNHTDIQERHFFGRAANVEVTDATKLNYGRSIGQLIAEEIQGGRMSGQDAQLVEELLTARFAVANRAPRGAIADIKNVMYMSTIGNPVSALTQIGDIGVSAYAHGLYNTMVSVFGRKAVTAADLGVMDIAQEFASTTKTAQMLTNVLKYSGFTAIDQLGKNTSINAALRKYQKMSLTPKGIAAIRKKYGSMFVGNEMDRLVTALKNKQVTKDVKAMLFSELADLQPITTSEMSAVYNRNPNGRIFYMLKTFTLKQLDIMRRDIWKEFNTGSKRQAMINATRYMTLISFFNFGAEMTKRALLTGEIHEEDVSDIAVSNLFKQFGASEYIVNKYLPQGKVGQMIGEMVMPPVNVVDGITGVFMDPTNINSHLKHMPIAGRFWYYWVGDGVERMNQRREENRMKSFKESYGGL